MEDKTQLLYQKLTEKGLYTKTFDEFTTQFADPTKRELLHGVLSKKGLYTKPLEEFNVQFFTQKKKDISGQDALTSASGKEDIPFLGQSGQNLVNPQDSSIQPSPSVSDSPVQNTEMFASREHTIENEQVSESTRVGLSTMPNPREVKEGRKTTVEGDLFRTLKSSSLRVLGAVGTTPAMINRTVQTATIKPIMKAFGMSDEEAENGIDYINSLNTMGQSMQLSEEGQKYFNKKAQKTEEKIHQIQGNIWENITDGKDGKKDYSAALELLGRGSVASLPYLALTASTAGAGNIAVLGTIGAVATSQQYAENEGMKTEEGKILNAWMYGFFEAAGELASAYIFRGIGKAFTQGLKREIAPESAKSIAKGIATAVGLESSSEGITQIGQNVTDIITGKDPSLNVLSNVFDAIAIGGLGFGLPGGLAKPMAAVLGKTLASDKEVKQVQENFKQQEVLINQIENTDSDPVKNALKRSIKELRVQSDEVMDANYELATKLSPEKQSQVAELYSVWNELQEKVDSGEIPKQDIPAIEKTIDGIKNQIQGVKEELIAEIEEEEKAAQEGTAPKKEEAIAETTQTAEGTPQTDVTQTGIVSEEKQGDVSQIKQENAIELPQEPSLTGKEELNKPKIKEEQQNGKDGKQEDGIKGNENGKNDGRNDESQKEKNDGQKEEVVPLSEKSENTGGDIKPVFKTNKQIGDAFTAISGKLGRSRLEGVLDNWNESRLSPDGDKIISNPFRRNAVKGMGSPISSGKKGFVEWLLSDAPFDEKVYGKNIKNDTEWTQDIKDARDALGYTESAPKSSLEESKQETIPSQTDNKAEEVQSEQSPQKQGEIAPIISASSNVPPKPPKSLESTETEGKKDLKRTGFEQRKEKGELKGSIELRKSKDEIGKAVGDIIDKNPHFYKVYHKDEVIVDAKAFIEEKGIDDAYADLIGKTKDIDEIDMRHVARQLLMQYFGKELVESQKLGDKELTNSIADKITNIEYRIQVELRGGMRMGAFTMWNLLDPSASVFMVEKMINEANAKKLGFEADDAQKFVKAWEKEVPDMVKKLLTENQDFKDAIGKLEARLKYLESKQGKELPRRVTKEKAKEIADKVRSLKSSNWGLNFADATGAVVIFDGALELTAKTIETTGNVLQAISDGIKYIKASDWYKGLTTDQKKQVEGKYSDRIKGQFDFDTKEYIENSSWFKSETKAEPTEDEKQKKAEKKEYNKAKKGSDEKFRDQVYDIIASHFLIEKGTKESLSDKLQNELGLSPTEAKKISEIVLKSFEEGAKKVFEKTLAPKIANKGIRKTSFEKFFGLIKRGVLNSDNYYELFATEYKLRKNLTPDEKQQLVRLGINTQNLAPYGYFGDIASNEMMQYLTKISEADNWATRQTKLMVAFNYHRMLSGPTTHFVNLKSSGLTVGIFRWLFPVINIGRWVDTATAYLKGDKIKAQMINPIADMYYQSEAYRIGARMGATELKNIIKHGNIKQASKYLESVGNAKGSNVPVLERDTYGKGKAFKPFFLGKDNKYDANILNNAKLTGRALLAEDSFMFNIPFAHELALAARRMEIQKGSKLSEAELRNKILNEINGTHLTEAQAKDVESQLEMQVQALRDIGYNPDANQIKQRRFEITRSMLDLEPEMVEDATQLARGDIFTDRRAGIFSVIGDGAARLFNRNLVLKVASMPKMPFTGVLGRIGDFTLDTMYGGLRARGWSPTGIIARARMYHQTGSASDFMKSPMNFDLFSSAQMGVVGSPRYYQQMNRQYAGMITLMALGGLLLRDDEDEDPRMDITGELPFTDLQGKSKHPMGQYTLKLGKWQLKYINYPIIAMPLSLIGNYKDHMRAGVKDEEFGAKFWLAVHAMYHSMGMMKDTSLGKGLGDLVGLLQDAITMFDTKKSRETLKDTETGLEDEEMLGAQFEKAMKEIGQSYIDLPLRYIDPLKNNLIQQIWKGITPEGRLKGKSWQLLAYNLGLQNIANDKRTDIFGQTVRTLPGEQGIAWPRQDDKRWDKIWEYDINLTDISEKDTKVIKGVTRTFEWDEYIKRKETANALFKERFDAYFKNTPSDVLEEKKAVYESIGTGKSKTKKTLVDIEVNEIWKKAKEDTDRYLFTWDKQVKAEPKLMDLLYEEGVLPKFYNEKMVLDDGELIPASKSNQPKEKQMLVPFNLLEEVNEKAMVIFIENTKYLLDEDIVSLREVDEDTKKSALQEDVDDEWKSAILDAKSDLENKMLEEGENK